MILFKWLKFKTQHMFSRGYYANNNTIRRSIMLIFRTKALYPYNTDSNSLIKEGEQTFDNVEFF